VGRQILTTLTVMQQMTDADPDVTRRLIDLTGLGAAFGAPYKHAPGPSAP